MKLPTLRTAPHDFVIDSIGGMNEGYSETTCRRIEDVVAPEYGKAMVEEYIDQWVHDRFAYYDDMIISSCTHHPEPRVKYEKEECPRGGWVKLTPKFDESIDEDDIADWGVHTLFIQVYDGTMLGDGVVVYDQMDDSVQTICPRHTAMRVAEEATSLQVDHIKAILSSNISSYTRRAYLNNLIHAYDSLADVVRCLEFPQACMIDIDDTCLHFFPTQAMRVMTYNGNNVIITL